jgi:hypothetical protein
VSEDLYELLKRKDRELAAYRELVDALRNLIAETAQAVESDSAWKRAWDEIGTVFYEHGFKSDGRFRG